MAINNFIKISELNDFTASVANSDFIPLVDSSSMTTYRVAVSMLASSSAFEQNVHVSSSLISISSSYASRSLNADTASISENVRTKGYQYYFPHWTTANTPSTNGALDVGQTAGAMHSPLFVTYSALASSGIIVIDPQSSINYSGIYPDPTNRSDYRAGGYWKWYNNTNNGDGRFNASGIFTSHPIISPSMVTDQVLWYFSTGSGDRNALTSFWSGSSRTGFLADITQSTGPTSNGIGAISQSFNGKWIRIASNSYFGGTLIASHSNAGEMAGGGNLTGRVKILLSTTQFGGASNTQQTIDFQIHDGVWGGGISAQIFHASTTYGRDHIRKLRLSIWSFPSVANEDKQWDDPMYALDIFVDDFTENDYVLSLSCKSYGGLRFNNFPTVDPIPLINTASVFGHNDPKTATYLEFPAAPGYYSNLGETPTTDYTATGKQPYFIQGKRVYITPHRNEITESANQLHPDINYKPYSLYVSGTIGTQQFCSDMGGVESYGQSGVAVAYDAQSAAWKKWVYKGGILIDSSSAASNPNGNTNVMDTVPIGTVIAWAGGTTIPNNWLECNGNILPTSSYWELSEAIKNDSTSAAYGYRCNSGGGRNVAGHYFKMPDFRGEFLRGFDNGRGVDVARARSSAQASNLGDHYHGIGAFNNSDDDNGFFVRRSWNDGNSYTARGIYGERGRAETLTLSNPEYSIATTNPVNGSAGNVAPRNVSVIYIIKYSGAVNFADSSTVIAGDAEGNVTSTTVAKIRGVSVDTTSPTNGQVLQYDSGTSKWKPTTLAASFNMLNVGKSWIVVNPGGILNSPNGNEIYVFNYNRHASKTDMVKLNMITNQVTYQATASNDDGSSYQWNFYGRLFYTADVPAVTSSLYQAYYFTNLGLHRFDPNLGDMRKIGPTGHYYDLPVSVSFNTESGSMPTIWSLYGSYGAGVNGNYPILKYRQHFWKSTGWSYRESIGLDLSLVQNSTEFLKFMRGNTSTNTMLWDYNHVNGRFYLSDTSTGYIHIFESSVAPFTTNWDASIITYYRTYALPSVGNADWSDSDVEKYTVDYDPITGEERGITYLRRSNQDFGGVVCYAVWPE